MLVVDIVFPFGTPETSSFNLRHTAPVIAKYQYPCGFSGFLPTQQLVSFKFRRPTIPSCRPKWSLAFCSLSGCSKETIVNMKDVVDLKSSERAENKVRQIVQGVRDTICGKRMKTFAAYRGGLMGSLIGKIYFFAEEV